MASEPMSLEQALAYLNPADADNGTISLRAPKAREAVAVISAEIAALQSRAFEDGARISLRDHRALTLRRMYARAERMMQTAYRAGNATDGAIYREEVDALTWVLAALQPEGERNA